MKTIGISPKVVYPVILQIVVGVVLILLGNDVEGKTLLFTALGTAGIGGVASPGDVIDTRPDPPDPQEV